MQEKLTLIQSYIQCYNAFDIDGLLALLSDDIVFENESGGEINARTQGKEDFRNLASQSAALFSERQQTTTNIQMHNDRATVDIDYRATVAADLDNGLKAGQVLELQGQTLFEFNQNKISYIKDIS
ncbi:nuclear transport factor 2 family protein [Bacterioplanes sanyensis]|nr:nuclear transport factor 2 family protein [Bacterioplanes sanyensis]